MLESHARLGCLAGTNPMSAITLNLITPKSPRSQSSRPNTPKLCAEPIARLSHRLSRMRLALSTYDKSSSSDLIPAAKLITIQLISTSNQTRAHGPSSLLDLSSCAHSPSSYAPWSPLNPFVRIPDLFRVCSLCLDTPLLLPALVRGPCYCT